MDWIFMQKSWERNGKKWLFQRGFTDRKGTAYLA